MTQFNSPQRGYIVHAMLRSRTGKLVSWGERGATGANKIKPTRRVTQERGGIAATTTARQLLPTHVHSSDNNTTTGEHEATGSGGGAGAIRE